MGLRLLGLGRSAGNVVVGTEGVRAGLRKGDVVLVVLAADHSPRTDQKVGRLARGQTVPVLLGPPSTELGRRLGCAPVQTAGVRDPQLAAGMLGHPAAQ